MRYAAIFFSRWALKYLSGRCGRRLPVTGHRIAESSQQESAYLRTLQAVLFASGSLHAVLGLDALAVWTGILVMIDLAVRRRVFR
jgi:hypothetical protein